MDAEVVGVLGQVMAQQRSAATAFEYVCALGPGVKANCWALAEAAGHEGWHRMQALLGSYRWDYRQLRGRLAALAAAWLPHEADDLIGPGIAIDETAALKRGDATAAVAPQHAGCTGKVENCVTTVFTAYVTATDQTWVDFDIYLPKRWVDDQRRRQQAAVPEALGLRTKPQLAIDQLDRLVTAGLPINWVAFDEVYGRSGELRRACEEHNLAYVAIVPCNFPITTCAGTIRADAALADVVFERRSAGIGSKGRRYADWALVATASPHHHLLIRRLISRPDQYTFYLCYAPPNQTATMTFFVTVSGRRWPVEETFATGKDVLGWDTCQARTWTAQCRHTTLAALAQLRQTAIRARISRHPVPGAPPPAAQSTTIKPSEPAEDSDLQIPIADAPIPTRPNQPIPPRLGLIGLTVAETARLADLAADWTAGLITHAYLTFKLRWSARRRRHQATARWRHHTTRLARP